MFSNKDKNKKKIVALSDYNQDKILVLFIHGLAGNENSWSYFENLLKNEKEIIKKIDLAFYSYPTTLIQNPFKKYPNLIDVADGLRSFIDINCKTYTKIILVCHSMGGLIGRKYILETVMSLASLKVKSLLLYATPNNGSDIANYANSIYRFNEHISQLRKGSDFIRELDRNWQRFKVSERIKVTFIVAGSDSIVDQESARGHWGEFSVEIDIGKTHKNIIRVQSKEDMSYEILVNEINSLSDLITNDEEEHLDDDIIQEIDFGLDPEVDLDDDF